MCHEHIRLYNNALPKYRLSMQQLEERPGREETRSGGGSGRDFRIPKEISGAARIETAKR